MAIKRIVKAMLLVGLMTISFNVFADTVTYIGSPVRPAAIWVPGHCNHGCWVQGKYYKFLTPVCRANLVWVSSGYDNNGNWMPAHWQLNNYVIVNPGSDSAYPGWAM